MATCNCPKNNCTCGCQNTDPCSIPACPSSCSTGESCAQTESSCAAEESECCTNCNLFVETIQSFTMPECDGTGSMFVDDASRLAPGARLYADGVGYLDVVSIVDATEVIVQNNCPECENQILDAGQVVTSGTQFSVGIPFCASEGDVEFTGPRLNSDFFIPNVGLCVTIAVTTSDGLAIGDTVSIASNRYRINDIPTTTTLEICNDGEGGTPGTLVEKDPDGDGVLNYPVTRISGVNPCTADPVECGNILVCSTGSTQQTLQGSIENQVPAWDESGEQFCLKVVDNLATCATLKCCLTLDDEADPCDEYLIDINQSTGPFDDALNDVAPNPLKITIDGDPFCLTEVIDGDTLRVIPAFEVTEVQTYEEGAVICIDNCCAQCYPHILTLDDSSGTHGCSANEILTTTGIVNYTANPGVNVFTLPASIGTGSQAGFEPGAGYVWSMDISNEDCCDCRQYAEVTTNYEMSCTIDDPSVFVNIELRILKILPVANSQAFAAHHFTSARGVIAPLPADYYLLAGHQTINTCKGTVYDRTFIEPGELAQFKGHIRIVAENIDASPHDFDIVVNWRAWPKVWNYDCVNATIDIP